MTATLHPLHHRPRQHRAGNDPAARHHAVAVVHPPNYLARRVGAAVLALLVLAAAAVAAGRVVGAVADLGGRPAAASEVSTGVPAPATHVAAPGDTLWSIADQYRGEVARDRYLDALVALNGGTAIVAGQAVRLP